MQTMLRFSRPIVFLVVFALLSPSVPPRPAEAAMVTTEAAVNPAAELESDRAQVRAFLERDDVRAQMEGYGLTPEEAIARVDSLTDREIALVAGKLDALPAGGYYFYGEILALAVLGVVALLLLLVWGVKTVVEEVTD